MQEYRELWTSKRLHRFNTAQNRKLRLSDRCASLAEHRTGNYGPIAMDAQI
jgi:hypothetical protein